MSIAEGTRLSHYEIRSQIGAGGMGEVYLAVDTQFERTVALKILPAEVASDQQRVRRQPLQSDTEFQPMMADLQGSWPAARVKYE